jgi:type IV pilus assembly protein PilW
MKSFRAYSSTHRGVNSRGFTLVEIMIALFLSGVIMAAVSTVFISQQRTFTAQDQVVEMQQNLRAALQIIEREIRMAGYNPTGAAGAGITFASAGQLSFTQDLNDDGDVSLLDPDENIDFGFSVADDGNRDGIPNAPPVFLRRQINGGGYQAIAENIDAIEFRYLDAAGAVTATPADIRTVQISILARAGQADRDFTNSMTYRYGPAPGDVWGPFGDNFRRRMLTTTVQCRNMGL